jgi:hypothetical protein
MFLEEDVIEWIETDVHPVRDKSHNGIVPIKCDIQEGAK